MFSWHTLGPFKCHSRSKYFCVPHVFLFSHSLLIWATFSIIMHHVTQTKSFSIIFHEPDHVMVQWNSMTSTVSSIVWVVCFMSLCNIVIIHNVNINIIDECAADLQQLCDEIVSMWTRIFEKCVHVLFLLQHYCLMCKKKVLHGKCEELHGKSLMVWNGFDVAAWGEHEFYKNKCEKYFIISDIFILLYCTVSLFTFLYLLENHCSDFIVTISSQCIILLDTSFKHRKHFSEKTLLGVMTH